MQLNFVQNDAELQLKVAARHHRPLALLAGWFPDWTSYIMSTHGHCYKAHPRLYY